MKVDRQTTIGIFASVVIGSIFLIYALYGDPPYAFFGLMRWFIAGTNAALAWLLLSQSKAVAPIALILVGSAGLFLIGAMAREDWTIFNWGQICLFALASLTQFILTTQKKKIQVMRAPTTQTSRPSSHVVAISVLLSSTICLGGGMSVFFFIVKPRFEAQIQLANSQALSEKTTRESIEKLLESTKSQLNAELNLRKFLEKQVAAKGEELTMLPLSTPKTSSSSQELPVGTSPSAIEIGQQAWLVIVESGKNVDSIRAIRESLKMRFGANAFIASSDIWTNLSQDYYAVVLSAYTDKYNAEKAVQFAQVHGFSDAYLKGAMKLK